MRWSFTNSVTRCWASKMPRPSTVCRSMLLLASAFAASTSFGGEQFPTRPISIVVPFPPGGLIDTTTRFIAQKMQERLGKPVVVDNRPGANGLIAIRFVKSAPADGYTLLAASNAFALGYATAQTPGYEFKDFSSIGGMNESPLILVASQASPAATLEQVLKRAKERPNASTFASGGVGTSSWMAGAMFASRSGAELLHVPYKGVSSAMPDVIAGRVDMMFDTGANSGPQIKDGRLRAYGISSLARAKVFPDIPTLAEQGVTNFKFSSYQGLLAPAGTPQEVVGTLSRALSFVVSSEAFQQRCMNEGSEPLALAGDAFMDKLRHDAAEAARLLAAAGIAKQ